MRYLPQIGLLQSEAVSLVSGLILGQETMVVKEHFENYGE